MTTKKSLEQALKEILGDDQRISKYEARVLKELILADGKVSKEEQRFLEKAISENMLDEQAYQILSQLLSRSELK